MSNKYLNDNQKGLRKKLTILGIILLLTGLGFSIVGMSDFFMSMGSFNAPTKFWCNFIGMPLIFAGIVLVVTSNQGKIARFTANQTAPVAKDVTNYMVDGTRDEVVKTFKEATNKNGKICPKCGATNDHDASFCDNCGTQLIKVCPNCGMPNDTNAKYCDECGKKL